MMTIGQFSERTGMKPKTLRYYEETGLLVPAVRLANGYRQYADEQTETAQLIHSLRQADVSMASIQKFLVASPEQREELLARWREEASAKLLSIQVANQFLNGLNPHTKRIHLVHWDRPKQLAWRALPEEDMTLDFASTADRLHADLTASGFTAAERSAYVRFLEDSDGRIIRSEIGFVLDEAKLPPNSITKQSELHLAAWRLESHSSTLFATMECNPDMPLPCRPIFAAIRQFGFRPVGTPLRKYAAFMANRYVLMVPVVRYEFKGE